MDHTAWTFIDIQPRRASRRHGYLDAGRMRITMPPCDYGDIPDITLTMTSGTAYDYTLHGYLIEQQTRRGFGVGTVIYSSVVQNPTKLADAEISASLETRVPKLLGRYCLKPMRVLL